MHGSGNAVTIDSLGSYSSHFVHGCSTENSDEPQHLRGP